jgi:hypothetical protein
MKMLFRPHPAEAEFFYSEITKQNNSRTKIFAVILFAYFAVNIVIDVLHYNRLGQNYFLYLDIIIVCIALLYFFYIHVRKEQSYWPGIVFTAAGMLWTVALSVFSGSFVPIFVGAFIAGMLVYMRSATALILFSSAYVFFLLFHLLTGKQSELTITRLFETAGIFIWAWAASAILFSSKLTEFRYKQEVETLTKNQEKIIHHRTESLEHANRILEDKIKEREVLVKEVHHRVKNNLQILASLVNLSLEMESNDVPEISLINNRNRIESMAMVYNLLCTSENIYPSYFLP